MDCSCPRSAAGRAAFIAGRAGGGWRPTAGRCGRRFCAAIDCRRQPRALACAAGPSEPPDAFVPHRFRSHDHTLSVSHIVCLLRFGATVTVNHEWGRGRRAHSSLPPSIRARLKSDDDRVLSTVARDGTGPVVDALHRIYTREPRGWRRVAVVGASGRRARDRTDNEPTREESAPPRLSASTERFLLVGTTADLAPGGNVINATSTRCWHTPADGIVASSRFRVVSSALLRCSLVPQLMAATLSMITTNACDD